jgi:predicted DsbA family dithiol-disulfide isomerase
LIRVACDCTYSTFDAHRLLHWAEREGRGRALQHALFRACFNDNEDISAHATLVRLANTVGLDAGRARRILSTDEYAAEVRSQQHFYAARGIQAVPAVIINKRHLISGGQPVETFARALRQIASA